ncbi:phage portal protein [Mesorhizobium sp. M7A.F.Ca.US.001.04.1.1]|uniref:phage portal protein n=1 Tax=unclassified Mesorhizobium TaxID=325217 RepID=UPI000FCAE800|nr:MULTISPECIES: phage portal protein [unclassified Mesorhizobium]RUY31689.1 phage portal protein [Mesorhizobium sp. M7A.F.Ca.US.001.04.2.1]RUY44123.1 phage portal protein [Mesorhizobium sp. M7A.F.Ca.US.001.04.1.1]
MRNGFGRVVKALGFGSEQKALPLSDPGIFELFGAVPSASGVTVTASTALHVPAVLHAVRLISETIGSLPCKLYREEGDSKEAAKDHGSYRLVHRFANEWTSAGHLRVDLTADALMHGAGYAEVIRVGDDRPYHLFRLTPGTVQRRLEDDGEPYYLVQRERGRQVRLSYRDVLYVPAFGGVSPIALGKDAIGVAMVLERHASKFFAGGARPSGVISNEKPQGGDAGSTTLAKIKNAWRAWQSNANGDPLILDAGWKYDARTMPSTDAQFIENRLEQINEIARIFGVPPHMLYQLERATWSNAEQMAASFLQLCLRPWLDRWQDAYATVLLTEDEQDDLYFEFVIDDLQRADAAGRAEIFGKLVAMRAMTPNEVRAAMNMPAIEGGDELANPYTTTSAPAGKIPTAGNDNADPAKEAA